jgi:hypothetical protein
MKRSDKKAQKWAGEFVDSLPSDVLETVQRKPDRLVCTCKDREPRKPHRAPCPLMGKFAGRKQPSRPMTPRQVEQRRAFDARRVVLPESIAAEVRAIVDLVNGDPNEGTLVATAIRLHCPRAFRAAK